MAAKSSRPTPTDLNDLAGRTTRGSIQVSDSRSHHQLINRYGPDSSRCPVRSLYARHFTFRPVVITHRDSLEPKKLSFSPITIDSATSRNGQMAHDKWHMTNDIRHPACVICHLPFAIGPGDQTLSASARGLKKRTGRKTGRFVTSTFCPGLKTRTHAAQYVSGGCACSWLRTGSSAVTWAEGRCPRYYLLA